MDEEQIFNLIFTYEKLILVDIMKTNISYQTIYDTEDWILYVEIINY